MDSQSSIPGHVLQRLLPRLGSRLYNDGPRTGAEAMAEIDRILQFLINAGYEPGEQSASLPAVITTATAPAMDNRSPRGVYDTPGPPGMIAIQALDDEGEEFAYFRIRASAYRPAMFRKMQQFLDEHVPGARLKLMKD